MGLRPKAGENGIIGRVEIAKAVKGLIERRRWEANSQSNERPKGCCCKGARRRWGFDEVSC